MELTSPAPALVWHHFIRDLRLMTFKIRHAPTGDQWICGVLIAFALVFLIVGLMRLVEFRDLGLSSFRRRTLSVMHVLGCLALSFSFVIVGADFDKTYLNLLAWFAGFGLTILVPLHIYINLLRRIKIRQTQRLN